MAPFDRIRRMAKAENRIDHEPARAEDLHAASGSAEPKVEKAEQPAPPIPKGMENLYVETVEKEKSRHFYRDYQRKDLVARASDTWIATTKQDKETIKNLVEYAQANDWKHVTLRGTEDFRREAWIEAESRGIEAKGYKPSEPDIQEARRRAIQAGRNPDQNEIHKEAAPAQAITPGAAVAAADPEKAQAQAQAPANDPKAPGPAKATDPQKAEPAAQADKLALRDGMSAPEHRAVTREARKHLSEDGKLVLTAINAKIDKEMDRLGAESKARLKAVAAVEMVQKEREQGPIALTQEQRDLAKTPPTPEQELQSAQEHKAALHAHISNAKTPVSDKVIERYDTVAAKVEKLKGASGKEQGQEQKKAPEPAPKPKAQQPDRKEHKREQDAPRRSRSMGR